MRAGRQLGIEVAGREHTFSPEDVILTMRAPDGYSVERDGAHAVALDLALDDALIREGRVREIVHVVQNARRTAGLQVEDRIELALDGDAELTEAARSGGDYIARETLALRLALGDEDARTLAPLEYSEEADIEGRTLRIALRRAPAG